MSIKPICDARDCARLFGLDDATVLRRVKAGKFTPRPMGELKGAPVWHRDELESAANEYWSTRRDAPMHWLHPGRWDTADDAAREAMFYRNVGASVFRTPEGPFVVHAPIGMAPSRTLRMMQRFGSNIDWRMYVFTPEASAR